MGAAGLGYGQGELKGEQEAWRRKQQEEALALRSLLAQRQARPLKEDEPLPLKAMFDARERVISSNDPNAWRNWIETGQEDAFNQMSRGYSEGYLRGGAPAARQMGLGVLSIANRPAGEDVSGDLERLAAMGTAARPASRAPGAYVSPAALAARPGAPAPNLSYVQPALRGTGPQVSILEANRAANVAAQTKRIETLLPHEVEKFKQDVLTGTLDRDLTMRKANWERSADTFKMWLDQAKFLVEKGQTDYRLVADVYGKLLNFAGDLQRAGAQSGSDLNAFLKIRSASGEILNPEVARMKLQQSGRSPEEIEYIIGSWQRSAGLMGPGGGGAPGGAPAAGGGVPQLPPIAGAPGAPAGASPAIPGWALGKNANVQGMASNAREALNWAVQELTGLGIKPRIESAHRDTKKQAQLYAAYKAGKGPVAAPPGSSTHEHGTGVDIHVPKARQADLERVMFGRGYVRTVDSEPWHFEYQGSGQQAAQPGGAPSGTSPAGSGSAGSPGAGMASGGPQSLGINTPGTVGKPPNPYTGVDAFAAEIHDLYTGGQISAAEIIREFQHNPQTARRVQQIIEQANTQQGAGGVFQGLPVPSTNGAVVPNPPSPGGLAYDNAAFDKYGIGASGGNMQPGVPTRPIANTTGFPQQPEVIVEPAPMAPPPPAAPVAAPPPMVTAPPPAPPPAATIPVPAPVDTSGPPLMGRGQGPGIEGPSLMGSRPRKSSAGPSVTGSKGSEKGPRVGAPNAALDAQASEFQERIARKVAAKPAGNQKAYREQIAKHEKHDFAPGVKKWLAKHKINDPATVLAVYEEALKNFAKKVAGAPRGQRAERMFKLLEEQLKPAEKTSGYREEYRRPFDQNFNTTLTPAEEKKFAVWKKKHAPRDSGYDYDLRGAFKAGLKPDPKTAHWPDTFKKPNHPTFSDESNYAAYGNPGRWEGERYIPPRRKKN